MVTKSTKNKRADRKKPILRSKTLRKNISRRLAPKLIEGDTEAERKLIVHQIATANREKQLKELTDLKIQQKNEDAINRFVREQLDKQGDILLENQGLSKEYMDRINRELIARGKLDAKNFDKQYLADEIARLVRVNKQLLRGDVNDTVVDDALDTSNVPAVSNLVPRTGEMYRYTPTPTGSQEEEEEKSLGEILQYYIIINAIEPTANYGEYRFVDSGEVFNINDPGVEQLLRDAYKNEGDKSEQEYVNETTVELMEGMPPIDTESESQQIAHKLMAQQLPQPPSPVPPSPLSHTSAQQEYERNVKALKERKQRELEEEQEYTNLFRNALKEGVLIKKGTSYSFNPGMYSQEYRRGKGVMGTSYKKPQSIGEALKKLGYVPK